MLAKSNESSEMKAKQV